MKNIDVINIDKSKFSSVNLNINDEKINCHAIYRAVNVCMSNKRCACAKTKNRSEVSGGGKKPWRQKGTGRARSGSIRSPLWVGGGIVFGPRGNQNFKLKQNSKEYLNAFRSSLLSKINDLIVVNYDFKGVKKTSDIIKILEKFELNCNNKKNKILIIVDEIDKFGELKLCTKNVKKIKLLDVNCINVYDIINAKYLLFTLKAFELINNKL